MTATSAAVYSVVFDLDGTLIDSIPDVVGALNRLLEEEGRRPITLDEGKGMVGEGAVPMVARAFAATRPEPTDNALAALVEGYLVRMQLDGAVSRNLNPNLVSYPTHGLRQ